MTEYRIQ